MGDLKCQGNGEDAYDGFPCNMNVGGVTSLGFIGAAIAISMAMYLKNALKGYPRGSEQMDKLSTIIEQGAKSFLITEYTYLSGFCAFVAVVLLLMFTFYSNRVDRTDGVRTAACFLAGAGLSALAGWIGMLVATDANCRTTAQAQEKGLNAALKVAFSGGAVMGFTVVGLGLLGVSLFLVFMFQGRTNADAILRYQYAADNLAAFGFGASAIALFARVAGGVYTKAADVGADLVGKVEAGIPEDDPRNPAVIADNVGDNVGDVAGMGADLFESFVGSIIAAITLARGDLGLIAYPFWLSGIGVISCFIGYFFVYTKDDAKQKELLHALHRAIYVSAGLVIILSAILTCFMFQDRWQDGFRYYGCVLVGLFAGVLIGEITEYFTSYEYWPVISITDAGKTGPATVIMQGLGIGMISCVGPMLVIVITVFGCNSLGGQYGISIAAVGMLSTLSVTLATDAYGPIADNAGGIAEMAGLPESVRDTTDALDALGNTTAATGKGFAIGSAVLTAISLLAAFRESTGLSNIDLGNPVVFGGILIGAMLPFLFAALTMLSVGKAAGSIIEEVRRQFNTIPGLREGVEGVEPDNNTCVAICTKASIDEMVLPGAYCILFPLTIGFLIGPACLAGMLAGSISSGAMMAIMMSTAGGAWDNSKKSIEIEKRHGGKGTDIHKACVVGDTVGDPFKDTSGPALNILIKLMSVISLTIAPLIKGNGEWENWYLGLIPLALLIGITLYYYFTYEDVKYKDSYEQVAKTDEATPTTTGDQV
jgi:inorganic pyrophosphatase